MSLSFKAIPFSEIRFIVAVKRIVICRTLHSLWTVVKYYDEWTLNTHTHTQTDKREKETGREGA